LGDYWKRWHMSLSSFCQRYVYMPVVGKTRNPYLSIFATMFAMGLWHAGSLNMIIWSLCHAVFLCGFQTWGRIKRRRGWQLDNAPAAFVGWAVTMAFVISSTAFAMTSGRPVRLGGRIFLKMFGVSFG